MKNITCAIISIVLCSILVATVVAKDGSVFPPEHQLKSDVCRWVQEYVNQLVQIYKLERHSAAKLKKDKLNASFRDWVDKLQDLNKKKPWHRPDIGFLGKVQHQCANWARALDRVATESSEASTVYMSGKTGKGRVSALMKTEEFYWRSLEELCPAITKPDLAFLDR